jgi:hypothetical protein
LLPGVFQILSAVVRSLPAVMLALSSVTHPFNAALFSVFSVVWRYRMLVLMRVDPMFVGVYVLVEMQFFVQQNLSVLHRVNGFGSFG